MYMYNYIDFNGNFLLTQQYLKKPVVGGDLQHPPAAPPPTQPAVYANTQPHFNPPAAPQCTQPVVYAGIKLPPAAPPPTDPVVRANYTQQSTNPPAAPPPTQPVVDGDLQQSTDLPAALPPTQPAVYANTHRILTRQLLLNLLNQ